MDFSQIALLLVIAAFLASAARLLKQPTIVGYIFAGLIISTLGITRDIEVFSGLSQVGVALLLFLVGIEMNLSELPSIGKVAFTAGVGQITFTSIVGFVLAVILGFSFVPALYIAVALTFSSTIIIIKLLSEKRELGSLYGRISLGVLLVQDLVAVLILMFLSGTKQGAVSVGELVFISLKAVVLILGVWFLSRKVIPRIFDQFLAHSTELLFISSIAWALGVAALVGGPMGFTLEIGGFLAGLALSNLPEHIQIASKTKPLRDFFLTIFFVLLGTQIHLDSIGAILPTSIIFAVFVLIGNPLILLAVLGFLGHKKRTSFLAGLTMAQISEFSMILMTMGLALGHVSSTEVSMVVLVGVITMTTSTYLITNAEGIYLKVKNYLTIFERKNPTEAALNVEKVFDDHVVLLGGGRTGKALIPFLVKKGTPFVVVDFNPTVFTSLTAEKVPVLFGDISDPDIYDMSGVLKARLVISTTNNMIDNLYLLESFKRSGKKPITMFTSAERHDGLLLYEKGADYVLVPHRIAGEHIRHIISTYGISDERIRKLGRANFNRLMSK